MIWFIVYVTGFLFTMQYVEDSYELKHNLFACSIWPLIYIIAIGIKLKRLFDNKNI